MKNIKIFDRRVGFSLGALSVLFGSMAPAVLPAFASADSQISNRSIALNDSSVSGTNVTYTLKFTPNEGGGVTPYYIGVEFCSDTPLMSNTCTAPTSPFNLNLSTLTDTGITGGTTDHTHTGASYTLITTPGTSGVTSGSPYTIAFTGVANPGATGSYYAKIAIFDTLAHGQSAINGTAALPSTTTGLLDDGSVAFSIANSVGVQAAVLESLTFCVFGAKAADISHTAATGTNAESYLTSQTDSTNGPAANCTAGATSGTLTPSVVLGKDNGSGVVALDSASNSYAADWAQISTNASSGAVVYLKTSNSCVGLKRSGAASCEIGSNVASGTAAGLTAGTGKFGVHFGGTATGAAALTDLSGATGNVQFNPLYTGKTSTALNYAMLSSAAGNQSANGHWDGGLPQDTTSAYGGYVFGTAVNSTDVSAAPAANVNVPFGFAATSSSSTPAGLYSATLNLNAVGTF